MKVDLQIGMLPPEPPRSQAGEGEKAEQSFTPRQQPLVDLLGNDLGTAGFVLILLLANMLSGEFHEIAEPTFSKLTELKLLNLCIPCTCIARAKNGSYACFVFLIFSPVLNSPVPLVCS